MLIDKLFYEDLIYRIESLIIYKNINKDPIIKKLVELSAIIAFTPKRESSNRVYYEFMNLLVGKAEELGLCGNILAKYVIHLFLQDENCFSLACEKNLKVKNTTLYELAQKDMNILHFLKTTDFSNISETIGYGENIMTYVPTNPKERMNIEQIMVASLREKNIEELMWYYKNMGVGIFANDTFFEIDSEGDIIPVDALVHPSLSDVVGANQQRKALIANTEDFVKSKSFQNTLISGPEGMGKSLLVYAVAHSFADKGLRLIELSKQQIHMIPSLVSKLSSRGKKFIIFIDKLNFKDYVENDKYLRHILSSIGSKNIVLYTTTDYCRIDNADDDIKNSNLNLTERFPLNVEFQKLSKVEYLFIVLELAKKEKLSISEDFLKEQAMEWERTHKSYSDQSARQFVKYIMRELKKD